MENRQAGLLKCIGEPTRLLIIKLLANGEKCVNDIVSAIDKDQPLVSHHLKKLKSCGIVISDHRAQKIYYRLSDPRIAEIAATSEDLLKNMPLCVSHVSNNCKEQ
jgi:ArsR family transcriptional regulator